MEMKDRIKELRLNKGLTQRELGVLLGVQDSVVAKYENGKVQNIKRATIEKMAQIFNCSPAYILCLDDSPKTEWNIRVQQAITMKAETRALISAFERLNSDGRSKALEYIADLVSMEKYTE